MLAKEQGMKANALVIVVAALLTLAATNANAQSVGIIMSGTSALFPELYEASLAQSGCGQMVPAANGVFSLTDTRPTEEGDPNAIDAGTYAWVTYVITGGTCAAPTGIGTVNLDMIVDSVVGVRCFMANPSCRVTTNANAAASGLPQVVLNFINTAGTGGGGLSINSAATAIRPEDALFATLRGLWPCPNVVGGAYLGIGYQTEPAGYAHSTGLVGTQILNGAANGAAGGPVNLLNFALEGNDPFAAYNDLNLSPPSWSVISVGAVPVVVFVNPSSETGFGSLSVTNFDRGVLSGFLDGTFQRVPDVIPQNWAPPPIPPEAFTFVREFLSGAYNTIEYAVPNSMGNQSSQDVGVQAVGGFPVLPPLECKALANSVTNGNGKLADPSIPFPGTDYRVRTIGAGNMITSVLGKANSLGYAFWNTGNFAGATPVNARYLTVDGIDPLQEVWQDGEIPTSGNGLLPNVSLSHVRDGSYPIWSIARIVCGSNCTSVEELVNAAENLVGPSQPDFVPDSSLTVLHSHFYPPGVLYGNSAECTEVSAGPPAFWNCPSNMSNGNLLTGENIEAGGDVGGVVYTRQADGDYNFDTANGMGIFGRRM
jgi:hypothetical protein